MIAAGKHTARAVPTEFQLLKTATKGTEYVPIVIKVGEESLEWQGYFSEGSRDRTIESLRIMGARMQEGDVFDLQGLGSKDFEVVIEHETFRDKTNPRVKWINRLHGPSVPIDDKAKEAFRAKMRGAAMAAKEKYKDEDDIPF